MSRKAYRCKTALNLFYNFIKKIIAFFNKNISFWNKTLPCVSRYRELVPLPHFNNIDKHIKRGSKRARRSCEWRIYLHLSPADLYLYAINKRKCERLPRECLQTARTDFGKRLTVFSLRALLRIW